MTNVIQGISVDEIIAVLHACGCRAVATKTNGVLRIESAAQGLAFAVTPMRAETAESARYTDFVFQCVVVHAVPADADAWNASRRFARMSQQENTVALTLDVLAVGGVTLNWLQAQCELWQLLLGEFAQHLLSRSNLAVAAAEKTVAA